MQLHVGAGPWCGHHAEASSYFDRLWKKEQLTERYVLHLRKLDPPTELAYPPAPEPSNVICLCVCVCGVCEIDAIIHASYMYICRYRYSIQHTQFIICAKVTTFFVLGAVAAAKLQSARPSQWRSHCQRQNLRRKLASFRGFEQQSTPVAQLAKD